MDVDTAIPGRMYIPPSSLLAQRRRASTSAAHYRAPAPPPTTDLPSIPDGPAPLSAVEESPTEDQPSHFHAPANQPFFVRPSPSPNLAAVAAFSQSRFTGAVQPELSQPVQVYDDLSDPPPPSILPTSSRLQLPQKKRPDPPPNPPLSPTTTRHHDSRSPTWKNSLNKALELAREAVQFDLEENSEDALMAYSQSVALLNGVLECINRGEWHGRRRSVTSKEEYTKKLQNTRNTYAERMNILSITLGFPPPIEDFSSSSPTSSETASASPPMEPLEPSIKDISRAEQQTEVILNPMSEPSSEVNMEPTITGLPAISSAHPYVTTAPLEPQSQPASPPNRSSILRRTRMSTTLPPPLPPPSNAPPPAPLATLLEQREASQQPPTITESRIQPRDSLETQVPPESRITPQPFPAIATNARAESPPLPAIPVNDEYNDPPETPQATMAPSKPFTPPQTSGVIIPRPRGVSARVDATQMPPLTIAQQRKTSGPSTPRSTESIASTSFGNGNVGGPTILGRRRSSSQPGRRPLFDSGKVASVESLPSTSRQSAMSGSLSPQRKASFPSHLNPTANGHSHLTIRTDLTVRAPLPYIVPPPPAASLGLPATPISPLPPVAPADSLRKPYHLMNLLHTTMASSTGGYITRRLHVPQEVWSQGGAQLSNLDEKIRVVEMLCSAFEELQIASGEHFGAGNVSSGLSLGIGSISRKDGEAWIAKLEEFSMVCDTVVTTFGKKLGVGEGFVVKKTTWSGKLGRRFDKFLNGKNLDSPATYVQGLKKLFAYTQLLDEHTQAITSQPIAPTYAALPGDIRVSADEKLKRCSEFFATVLLTFVIRDLSQLLDKYTKKCEKWLAE